MLMKAKTASACRSISDKNGDNSYAGKETTIIKWDTGPVFGGDDSRQPGWEHVWPMMPLYLQELKANVPQIGLFFTLSQIIPLLLQILGGWLSDSIGRLRAIAIGSVFGVFVFVPFILWHLAMVIIGRSFGRCHVLVSGPKFRCVYRGAFQRRESRQNVWCNPGNLWDCRRGGTLRWAGGWRAHMVSKE